MTPGGAPRRFGGFDVLSQVDHWDQITAATVVSRLGPPPPIRFFTPGEQAIASVLFDQLLDQHQEPRVPVLQMVDSRLAEEQTDGWHYADLPPDGQAWRDTLGFLDADANARCGTGFATCPDPDQAALLNAVQDLGTDPWHGMPAKQVWSLWTRYAATAFYSHPWAWNEIGFPGPAYPRGYKNPGIDTLEPFEVRDALPSDDPLRRPVLPKSELRRPAE